jgi:hypothetical protein
MAMATTTALAIGGLAVTAGTTAVSFIEAGKQKAKQRAAARAAESAMAEVRKQLSVNYFDERAIKKEPYELQREALLSQGALAVQAGTESERGGAATAGMVQMAQNQAQGGIRTEMGKDIDILEQQSLEEESRLRDLKAQLSLEDIAGLQAQAAEGRKNRGMEGIAEVVKQGLPLIKLFTDQGGEVTTSGSEGGPGANPLFQSSSSDQFSSSSSGLGSVNPYMPNTASKLNPFLYENMFSGVGGYRNA